MPTVRKFGLLPRVINSPSILSLSSGEIAERYGVLTELIGFPPYGDTKKGQRAKIHAIFSLTAAKYISYCQSYGISEMSRSYQREKQLNKISKENLKSI